MPPPATPFLFQVLFIVDIVDLFKPYRCFHGSELPLVFNLWPAMWGEGEDDLAQFFTNSWTSFAASGSPNYAASPAAAWAPFGSTASSAILSTGPGGVNVTNAPGLLADKCAFWRANPIDASVIWG